MSVERVAQMSAHDTLRWGDSESLFIPSSTPLITKSTKQLVGAHWRWPLLWKLCVVVVPQVPPGETQPFTVSLVVSLGSGSSVTTFTLPAFVVGPPYAQPPPAFFDLPAQDLQIIATMTSGPDTGVTAQIGAYVAPVTESHAGLLLLDYLGAKNFEARGPNMQMGPGFVEAPPVGLYR
jgi:hypothetical protein